MIRSVGSDLEACTAVGQWIGNQAGDEVLSRLRAFGGLLPGGAVVTPGGGLPTELLIHVVVRSSEDPISEHGVSQAFRSGLRQAAEWGVEVVAVPPLGIGAGNLNAEASARVMCEVAREHSRSASLPREIILIVGSDYEEDVFSRESARVFRVETL